VGCKRNSWGWTIILTDKEILKLIKSGKLKIEPFDRKRLGPVTYDLTTESRGLSRGVHKLVSVEEITMHKDVAGILMVRSRTTISGLFTAFSPLVDPGYTGHLIFLVYNPVYPNLATAGYTDGLKNVIQLAFFRLGEVKVPYNKRKSSTAQGRKGFDRPAAVSGEPTISNT